MTLFSLEVLIDVQHQIIFRAFFKIGKVLPARLVLLPVSQL